MGNSTHQNVSGLCQYHLHPQALLAEHQPCCHPPGGCRSSQGDCSPPGSWALAWSPRCLAVLYFPPPRHGAGKGKRGISVNSRHSQSLGQDLVWLRSTHWEILGRHCSYFNFPCISLHGGASHTAPVAVPVLVLHGDCGHHQPVGLRAPLDLL